MLESLRVRNFQAHKNRTIIFDKLVTTIIGPNDVGKSALFRSLMWVLLNRPRGIEFLRDGQERVDAHLKIDGCKVSRIRGKRRNVYKLNGKTYKAFGNKVPDEIADLLNVCDLNFQAQHDPPCFWFSLTPGDVSKRLNQVVDLGLIDSTLVHLSKAKRRSAAEVELVQERLDDARARKRKLRFVGKAQAAHDNLLELSSAAVEAKRDRKKLEELIESVKESEARIHPIPDLSTLQKLADDVKHASQDVKWLQDLLKALEKAKRRMRDLRKDHARQRRKLHSQLGGKPCPLCGEIPS